MLRMKDTALIISVLLWGILLGAIAYSHIAFFPAYLHHLPESTSLVQGPFRIQDEKFWMLIHPITLLSLLLTLFVNWKLTGRRKNILYAAVVYVAILVVTFIYFVPELKAFADSTDSSTAPSEWLERGKRWEHFSWIRGGFMFTGFFALLLALLKNNEYKKSLG